MKKINVLYIIWSLGLGGAEQVVLNLAKGLDKNSFEPFICCLNDEGRYAEEARACGIKVFALNKKRGLDFSIIGKIVKVIRGNNIQVVHTHLWGANLWGRLAAKKARTPVVVTEHNVDVWKSPFHFLIDRWLFGKTDSFIAVSETVRRFYAQKLGTSQDKIRVVYNGISGTDDRRQIIDDGREKLKQELGIKEGELVVAVVGRLVPQKGVGFFLDVFSRLNLSESQKTEAQGLASPHERGLALIREIKVLIVGDGPLLQSLKSQVASLKIEEKVKILGFRKDVADILNITDVLVLPSTREGLPMILLEGMAAGCVIVASRVGGTPELVEDGVSGYLFESGDAQGLKDKLEMVFSRLNLSESQKTEAQGLASPHERGLALIRENAKKTVEEKFSLKRMVGEHEGVYQVLVKGER